MCYYIIFQDNMSLAAWVKIILAVVVISVPGLYLCLADNYVSTLTHEGETIQIWRDELGIPLVRAASFKAAMYGWGYVTAEDRLFQISFRRLLLQGRLAEHIGEKGVRVDKMFRELNFEGWSQRTQRRFKEQNQTQYQHFSSFVKAINDHVASLTFYPLEFYLIGMEWQQWEVKHMFMLYKLLTWSQSQNMADEYFRSNLLKHLSKQQVDNLLPYHLQGWMKGQFATQATIVKEDEVQDMWKDDLPQKQWSPVEVEDMLEVGLFNYIDTDSRGSNSWVISGQHTQSGHPILVNDPHLDSALPGQWHQIRLSYTSNNKQYSLVGGGIAGVAAFIGQGGYMSSALTTIYGDSQDLYKQTVNYTTNQYLFDGKWRNLTPRHQTIKVKGAEPINYTIYHTHHGPIVNFFVRDGSLYEIPNEDISLCWAAFTDQDFHTLVAYSHAAEFSNYQDALHMMTYDSDHAPPMNLLYITKDAHIGYQMVGPHPVRTHPHMGMYVKDGSDSRNDWVGFVRDEEKLHLRDPKRGYIVTANNKPAPPSYQQGIFQISMFTARADRIEQLIQQQIAEKRKFTKADMKRILADTTDVYCLEVVKMMRKRVETDEGKYKKVFGEFLNFDCDFRMDSTTSTIYLSFLKHLYAIVHPNQPEKKQNFGGTHSFLQYLQRYIMEAQTQQEIGALQTAMNNAYTELEQFFQTSDKSAYRYGTYHQDRMVHRPFGEHPLLKYVFEHTGDGWGNWNTPNVGFLTKFHLGDMATYHRANIRNIISYHEDSQWIVDGGVSEKFYSRHYKDQLNTFMNNQYHFMQPKKEELSKDL